VPIKVVLAEDSYLVREGVRRLLVGVAGTVLVANLVAAWPGWVAARTRPAVALRSE
jgi:hypothetical protein